MNMIKFILKDWLYRDVVFVKIKLYVKSMN